MSILKRFVFVEDKHIHYRRVGVGPPTILLHESPKTSAAHTELMNFLSKSFTVFAFDTPGFGRSDALAKDKNKIKDFADIIVKTLSILKINRCVVFGNHTGACIALEIARRRPDLISGLVVESLPIFEEKETKKIIKKFFPPLVPKLDGSHLMSVWSKVRDQYIWFPWFEKSTSSMHHWPFPNVRVIHDYVMDFLVSGDSYRYGYSAAFKYKSLQAIKNLKVPAIFIAVHGDVLESHIDRLPKLKRNQKTLKINNLKKRNEIIKNCMNTFPIFPSPKESMNLYVKGKIIRNYYDLGNHQIHFRYLYKSRKTPALIMLHDSPGSSFELENLVKYFGSTRSVISIDLPGYGYSDNINIKNPTIYKFSRYVIKLIKHLGIQTYDIYGRGFGGLVAAEVSKYSSRRVILDRVHFYSIAEKKSLIKNYILYSKLNEDGSHLYKVWTMLKDHKVFSPWYDKNQVKVDHSIADFDPKKLHQLLVDIFSNTSTYYSLIEASISYKLEKELSNISKPVLFLIEESEKMPAKLTRENNSRFKRQICIESINVKTVNKKILSFLDSI